MIYIRLNPDVFDPTKPVAVEPFKSMNAARKAKAYYVLESSGSEIGFLPFSPPLMKDYGNGSKPWGQNSFRTLNISVNPIGFDETIINQAPVGNQGYLFNKIIAGIANGILIVTKDAVSTPLTAVEFSTLVFG